MFTTIKRAIQGFVAKDRTHIVAVGTQVVVALAAGLGFHVSGASLGVVSAALATGLGYIVSANFKAKLPK